MIRKLWGSKSCSGIARAEMKISTVMFCSGLLLVCASTLISIELNYRFITEYSYQELAHTLDAMSSWFCSGGCLLLAIGWGLLVNRRRIGHIAGCVGFLSASILTVYLLSYGSMSAEEFQKVYQKLCCTWVVLGLSSALGYAAFLNCTLWSSLKSRLIILCGAICMMMLRILLTVNTVYLWYSERPGSGFLSPEWHRCIILGMMLFESLILIGCLICVRRFGDLSIYAAVRSLRVVEMVRSRVKKNEDEYCVPTTAEESGSDMNSLIAGFAVSVVPLTIFAAVAWFLMDYSNIGFVLEHLEYFKGYNIRYDYSSYGYGWPSWTCVSGFYCLIVFVLFLVIVNKIRVDKQIIKFGASPLADISSVAIPSKYKFFKWTCVLIGVTFIGGFVHKYGSRVAA